MALQSQLKEIVSHRNVFSGQDNDDLLKFFQNSKFQGYWYQGFKARGEESIMKMRHVFKWFTNEPVSYRDTRLPANAVRLVNIKPIAIPSMMQKLLDNVNRVTKDNYNSVLVERFQGTGAFNSFLFDRRKEFWLKENTHISIYFIGEFPREITPFKKENKKFVKQTPQVTVSLRSILHVPVTEESFRFKLPSSQNKAYYMLSFRSIDESTFPLYCVKYPCIQNVMPVELLRQMISDKKILEREQIREFVLAARSNAKYVPAKGKKREVKKRKISSITVNFQFHKLTFDLRKSPLSDEEQNVLCTKIETYRNQIDALNISSLPNLEVLDQLTALARTHLIEDKLDELQQIIVKEKETSLNEIKETLLTLGEQDLLTEKDKTDIFNALYASENFESDEEGDTKLQIGGAGIISI